MLKLRENSDSTFDSTNQILFGFIKNCYWTTLFAGVRRLLDPYSIRGTKGVYSLRSVLDDVKKSQPWLTRRIYVNEVVAADYEPIGSLNAQNMSMIAHKQFDFLSGVCESDRKPLDKICLVILNKFKERLENFNRFSLYTNAYVAHASTPESRQLANFGVFDINVVADALKEMKGLAGLLGILFANRGSSHSVVFLGDKFHGLDIPLVAETDIEKLEDHWSALEREISTWNLSLDDL